MVVDGKFIVVVKSEGLRAGGGAGSLALRSLSTVAH